MSKVADTTPLAKTLEGMAAEKWNPTGAISELIDNALGAARGNASEVLCIYDKRERKLTIRDNGRGLDRLVSLFQLGRTIGISADDIGVRGMGGTKALLWLADQVRIFTMRDGLVMADTVRWKDHTERFPQVNDEWDEPNARTPEWLKLLGHGTHIELWLRPGRNLKEDQIQRELARTYSCGLRHRKKITWLTIDRNGRDYSTTLKGETFPRPANPQRVVNLTIDVPSDIGDLRATGVVTLVDDYPYKDSVVTIGFGHRAIMSTRRCYMSADGTRSYAGAGVVGYIDLVGGGWKKKLTTTKDDFDDMRVFESLMHQIFTRIEHLLEQTERDRYQIVLSELSLDLTAAFNGINNPDFDLVDSEDGINAGDAGNLRDDSVKLYSNNVRPFKPKVVDPARKGPHQGGNKKPPAARLPLTLVSDKDIDQALCRLQLINPHDTNLQVELNREHDIVTELMKPKAVNRMALAVMVMREVAAALVRQPATMELVLAKRIREKLDAAADDFSRERLLSRLLMDSVKRPRIAEDEAVA